MIMNCSILYVTVKVIYKKLPARHRALGPIDPTKERHRNVYHHFYKVHFSPGYALLHL